MSSTVEGLAKVCAIPLLPGIGFESSSTKFTPSCAVPMCALRISIPGPKVVVQPGIVSNTAHLPGFKDVSSKLPLTSRDAAWPACARLKANSANTKRQARRFLCIFFTGDGGQSFGSPASVEAGLRAGGWAGSRKTQNLGQVGGEPPRRAAQGMSDAEPHEQK